MCKITTRFAPSPTGDNGMHIGNLRSAIFSYLYAKKNNGKFILRIEDTDKERSNDRAVENILDVLKMFNLDYDEFYKQSERLQLYKEVLDRLLKTDYVYEIDGCYKLDSLKACKDFNIDYIQDGIRKNPIKVDHQDLYDIVLMKSDGYPTYHLASVVDDNAMGVTDIFRGDEWIKSYPYHIALYKILGYKIPNFYHIPLILNQQGEKLSKRDGSVSIDDLIKDKIMPCTLMHYVGRLGLRESNDCLCNKDLIDMFDPTKLNKSSIRFDYKKLRSLNLKYLRTDIGKEEFYKTQQTKVKFLDSDKLNVKLYSAEDEMFFTINKESDKLLVERLWDLECKGINTNELLDVIDKNIFKNPNELGEKLKKLVELNIKSNSSDNALLTNAQLEWLYDKLFDLAGRDKSLLEKSLRMYLIGSTVGLPFKGILQLIPIKRFE